VTKVVLITKESLCG